MRLLGGLEKLINEHGSATILKERIALANDKYAAIKKKFLESESRVKIAESRAQAAELQADNLESEKKVLAIKLSQAEEKIRDLEKQLVELIHNPPLQLKFNSKTGTWLDEKSSIHYCSKCKTNGKISPMRDEGHGWYCSACNLSFNDPDRPEPTRPARPPKNWRVG